MQMRIYYDAARITDGGRMSGGRERKGQPDRQSVSQTVRESGKQVDCQTVGRTG